MWDYFLFELKSKRGAILWWGLGMSLFVLLYVGLYPSYVDFVPSFEDLMELPIYQAMGMSSAFATFPGWVGSTVLNFLPIIVGIYALIAGTGTLAGEEERGTLETIATLALPRWKIVVSKYLSLLLALLAILLLTGLVTLGVTAWIRTQVEIEVSNAAVFWAVMSAFPLLAFLAAAALFLGAFLPTRGAAGGLAIVLLLASYFSNNLFGQIESLEGLRPLSPFYYFNATHTAITEGPAAGDVLVLTGLTVVFLGLALLSFQRRDLLTHAWFWQRARIAEA